MRSPVLRVLGLAAALRLVVFLVAVGHPQRFWSTDDRDYLGLATHLRAGYLTAGGDWFDSGLRRPPVYPLVIRGVFDVFGRHYSPVIALQIVLAVATVALVYWLATLLLPRGAALVAALLLAIDPASIVFTNQLLTETLFAFLLTLATALLILARRRSEPWLIAAAGLVLGLSVLTRPVAQYLPLILLPLVVFLPGARRRMSLLLAAALLSGFLVPVGGWLIRNHARTGVATISTIDGYDVLHYRAVGALVEGGMSPYDARQTTDKELAPLLKPGDNAAVVSRKQLHLGLHILREHPFDAGKSWARGIGRLLVGPARSETSILLTGRLSTHSLWFRALVLVDAALTVAIVLAAGCGIALLALRRLAIPELWILAATTIYLVAISGGPETYSRFRVPVAPLLAVLAAAAIQRALAAMRPASFEPATSASRHSSARSPRGRNAG